MDAAEERAPRTLGEPTLPFWVSYDETGEEETGDSMGLFGGSGEAALRQVPLGPLRKNLTEAVDALQQLFADVAARGGALPLREAQLSFQVTASGGVQFIGTAAQAAGSRGIVLVFRQ
ncbi:hypothetical protein P8605_46460 [Streptomyces sp. T-3]|nr:hypothetical protein [Streptomyces sp. T-3]